MVKFSPKGRFNQQKLPTVSKIKGMSSNAPWPMINDRHHPILLVFLVLAPGLNLSWQRWDAHLSARSQFLTCLSAECQKAPLIVESRIASSELGIISPSDNCVCKPQVPAFSQSHTGKVIKSASSPNQDTQCIDCLCHYISSQRLNGYFSNCSNTMTQGGRAFWLEIRARRLLVNNIVFQG